MTQLAVTQSSDLAIVPSFHAVAMNATEMQESREKIKLFLESKCAEVTQELRETTEAYETAKIRKWAHMPLYNQVRNITRRQTYYFKLLSAVNAGYTLVPNMPVDVFVIRTTKSHPTMREEVGSWEHSRPRLSDLKPELLPIGEGGYKSPQQKHYHDTEEHKKQDGSLKKLGKTIGIESYHDIEFPLAAAHSVVMEATDDAMKKLIFDRIGIVPQGVIRGKQDPIVLGQIILRSGGYQEKIASFLIAWHLDMRTL